MSVELPTDSPEEPFDIAEVHMVDLLELLQGERVRDGAPGQHAVVF